MSVRTLMVAVIMALATTLAPQAWANPTRRYQQALEHMRAQLAQHTEDDPKDITAEDRADVARWLDEADAALANGSLKSASQLLKRATFGLEVIESTLAAAALRLKALAQQKAYEDAKAQMEQMGKEIDELKLKKKQLEQEMRKL
ncbi:MAG: hypothetical protein AAGI01_12765 [Myxococcota bacterium]